MAKPKRPIRLCDVCGGRDDHPRHVQDGVPAFVRHIDCCAALGCATCAATEKVTKGVRGDDLTAAIHNGALDGFEPPKAPRTRRTKHG